MTSDPSSRGAQISYGHSDGRVQSKEEFIHGAAIACHIYLSQSELDRKATITRIGALRVWQEQDGGWKLLARQGFRLPA